MTSDDIVCVCLGMCLLIVLGFAGAFFHTAFFI